MRPEIRDTGTHFMGPHYRPGYIGEEDKLGIEPRFSGHSVCSQVALPTEQSRLHALKLPGIKAGRTRAILIAATIALPK